MKNILFLLAVLAFSFAANARKLVIKTDAGAQITVNGNVVGQGEYIYKYPRHQPMTIEVRKPGYLPEFREYSTASPAPGSIYIQLERNKAWDNSVSMDVANKDIDVVTSMDYNAAWQLITSIIIDKFDVIEVTDKSTGYLRTAWNLYKFDGGIVRSRMILKTSKRNPLTFKIKLDSEIFFYNETKFKNHAITISDENYRPWGRVLKTYQDIISEIQNRMNQK